jgi:hypothetical protein
VPAYALLIQPNANRVYGQVAGALLRSELLAVDELLLGGLVSGATETIIGGVPYIEFESDDLLDERAVAILSNLSSLHAFFRREGELLAPVEVRRADRYDEDLLTTQRYVGKTNESFTRLLVNLTLAANPSAVDKRCRGERVRLLDPMAGRGTTLNLALTYGFDAFGIELDKGDHEAYATFLLTWLKEKRVKHRSETSVMKRGRESAARRLRVHIGPKSAAKDAQLVDVVQDDTVNALAHFPRASFDAAVADLPYGVQHGSRSDGRLTSAPGELLAEALPVWHELLRHGASIGLAFNTRTLPRAALLDLLTRAGFEPSAAVVAQPFEHRVDRSITRDLVVAVKV